MTRQAISEGSRDSSGSAWSHITRRGFLQGSAAAVAAGCTPLREDGLLVGRKLEVEMRVQTFGSPAIGFLKRGAYDGFPGFQVPDFYKLLVKGMDGKSIQVPARPSNPAPEELKKFEESFEKSVEQQVRELFRAAVGEKEGPDPVHRWDLLPDALFTEWQGVRWRPGHEAIAFEVGTEKLRPLMEPTGEKGDYRQDWTEDWGVYAKFWLCFHLVE